MTRSAYGTVGDVMDRVPVCAHQTASLREVAIALDRAGVESAPVIDAERTVVGVVSVGDLLRRTRETWDSGGPGDGLTAAELMTSPAVTVSADTGVAHAAFTAARTRVHMLPVIDDDGVLLGVVRLEHLLLPLMRADGDVEEEVRRTVIRPAVVAGRCELSADVRGGVAHLSGWVSSAAVLHRLRREVAHVPGVIAVDADVEVDPTSTVFSVGP